MATHVQMKVIWKRLLVGWTRELIPLPRSFSTDHYNDQVVSLPPPPPGTTSHPVCTTSLQDEEDHLPPDGQLPVEGGRLAAAHAVQLVNGAGQLGEEEGQQCLATSDRDGRDSRSDEKKKDKEPRAEGS